MYTIFTFYSSISTIVYKCFSFLGFGVGRRQCPGELLARTRIFLFLANVLQKFDVKPVGDLPDRDVRKYHMAALLMPPPVTAKFVRRQ